MKKIYLLSLSLVFVCIANAQIAVTVAGNNNSTPSLSPTYPSLSTAITALNSVTALSGPVTFNLAAGTTESITSQLAITLAGDLANAIVFQKSGAGANPKLTRTDAGSNTTSILGGLGDAVIRIDGTDNIHFNGLDIATNNQGIEYGFLTSKTATNACQNFSIKNAAITLTKGTSAFVMGIYIGNGTTSVSSATGVTVSSNAGRTENVTITGNTISNVHTGIYCRGAVSAAFYDQNFVIGQSGQGNTIQNFGGGSATTTYGVYFIYTNNIDVEFNTINNSAGGGSAHASTFYSVYFVTVSGIVNFNNNSVTLAQSSTSITYGMYNANTLTSIDIKNNSFASSTLSSTGTLYMIYNSSSTPNVMVENNTIAGTFTRTGAGTTYCYYNLGSPASGTETFRNNNFSNITGANACYGYYSNTAVGQNRVANNNTFTNWTASGIVNVMYCLSTTNNQIYNNTISNITGGSTMYGIYYTGVNATVYNNMVSGLNTAGTTFYGLWNAATGTSETYKNRIYDLTTTSTSTAATTYGIYVTSGASNTIYNNLIGDLKAPSSASTLGVVGIFVNGGTAINLYYNSIYLNATSTGTNFSASGIYTITSPTVELINNIIVSESVANGTGINAAYRRSTATLSTYSANSNNNLFYTGTPSASNVIFFDGTTADQTLASYKATVAPIDNSSITEMPSFLSTVGTSPNYLHINPTVPTQIESGGTSITGIADDVDGNVRNATTPDIGADEFNGIGIDRTGPAISYTPIVNPSCNNSVGLSAEITDLSMVNTAAGTKPRLYFKKSTDANTFAGNTSAANGWKFVEASNVASPFVFTINYALLQSPVVAGNVIEYFVVAQDLNNPANVGVNAATFTNPPSSVNLSASAFPVANNLSYTITGAPTVAVTANPNPVCTGNPTELVLVTSQPGNTTVGSGTLTSTTSTPYYGLSTVSGRRVQYLFSATELTAQGLTAGNINSLSFNVTTNVVTAIDLQNWQIKMGNTTETEIPTTFSTGATTLVLGPTSYTPTTGTNTHTFTTPFTWDGTSNIVIEICNDPLVTTGTNLSVSYQVGPANSVGYATNALGCGSTTATRTTTRPIITFGGLINVTSQYVNFVWNDGTSNVGTNNDTTTVTPNFPSGNTMTYSVIATDAYGCTATGSVLVNKNTTTPTGTASSNLNTVCFGQSVTFTGTATQGCAPYTYSWSNGTNVVGTGSTLIFAPTASGTFTLTITDNAGQTFSPPGIPITVNNPQITSTTPGGACGAGPFNILLEATGSAATTLSWYANPTGGTPLATGNSFTTPPITMTTTYYVSASTGSGVANVGPVNNTFGTISSSNIAIGTQRMFFDVISPTVLKTVDIYPTAAIGSTGSVTIRNNTQAVIANVTYTTTVTGGALQTITLDIPLAPGTGYEMGQGTAINLNRNTSGAVYPYTSAAINITGNTFATDYYYFYYNWQYTSGCESSRTSVVAAVSELPTAFSVTGGGSSCAGSAGVPVGLSGSEVGVNYQLQVNSVNTGTAVPGTGAAISFGNQNVAGTYTVVATNAVSACTSTMIGSVTITVTPQPTAFTVTGGGNYCIGGAGVVVGLSGSETGVNYQLRLNGVNTGILVAGTGSAINFGSQTGAGTYTVTANNTTTTCDAVMMGSVSVGINPIPTQFTVTGGGNYCLGGTGVPVGLDGSTTGVSYQLQLNSTNVGAPVAGTGTTISFGNQTGAGNYTVIATNNSTFCTASMTGSVSVTIGTPPTPFAVTGGGNYCAGGTGVAVGLSGSQIGVDYQLQLNSVNINTPVAGTGAAISFGNQTAAGTYTVIASSSSCSNMMTGSVSVAASSITVTNPVIGNGQQGVPFSQTFTRSGGIGVVTFSTTSTLPTGITLSTTGVLSGTATQSGTFPIVVTATDAVPCSANGVTYNLVITAGPTSSVISVSGASTICSGSSANLAVTITGGTSPYTVIYTNGTTNFTVTNYISGSPIVVTPTATTTYTLVSVTDANLNPGTGNSGSATITVNPIATVNAVVNQVVCNGAPTNAVTFSSPTTGGTISYSWTNNTTSIGLAGSGTGNIPSFTASNTTNAPVIATITVTPNYSSGGITCVGTSRTFSITVNPTATVSTVANQTVCNGAGTTAINFASPTTGGTIVYNWTNNTPGIGLAASGTGNIPSFTATNTGLAPTTATITVTATYTNAAVNCVGTATTFTIVVNPTATVNAVNNQVVCSGAATTGINFSTTTTGGTIVYNWTNSATSIGLAASGTGDIPGFTATNTGATPVIATISVTASYTNGTVTCVGAPRTFTITVNPAATVNAVSNQAVCNGLASTPITFSSASTGGTVVYNWVNNTTSIGLGASGVGNIPGFVGVNTGTAPVIATISVTPSYTNAGVTCTGTVRTFTITVNPSPIVTLAPFTSVCQNNTPITLTGGSPVAGAGTTGIYFVDGVQQTVFNPANYSAGAHNIEYRYTNSFGCVRSAFQTITVSASHVVEITVSPFTALTPNTPTTISATVSPAGNYTYSWFKVGGIPVPTSNNADRIIVPASEAGSYYVVVTSASGCSVTSATAVTTTTAVPETLFVFPNPSTGRFNVAFSNGSTSPVARTLRVINSAGQTVFTRNYATTVPYANMEVNISNASTGMYMVFLFDDKGQILGQAQVIIR